MNTTIRQAVIADADDLARLAAVTFPLACPPDSKVEDIDHFIGQFLTRQAFEGYLRDGNRAVFVAEVVGTWWRTRSWPTFRRRTRTLPAS